MASPTLTVLFCWLTKVIHDSWMEAIKSLVYVIVSSLGNIQRGVKFCVTPVCLIVPWGDPVLVISVQSVWSILFLFEDAEKTISYACERRVVRFENTYSFQQLQTAEPFDELVLGSLKWLVRSLKWLARFLKRLVRSPKRLVRSLKWLDRFLKRLVRFLKRLMVRSLKWLVRPLKRLDRFLKWLVRFL